MTSSATSPARACSSTSSTWLPSATRWPTLTPSTRNCSSTMPSCWSAPCSWRSTRSTCRRPAHHALMASRRRLGSMGGPFDPIRYGHFVTAEEARVQFGLEQVIFVPNRRPPHKDPREVTDPEHRYLMTFLATATNPHFTISRLEVEREGPSYTIDTIVEFK